MREILRNALAFSLLLGMGYHHDVLEIDDRHIPTNREDMWHNWNLGAKKPSGDFVSVQPWCGKRHLFLSFPYVCPEPVLAKWSFLYINGAKRRVFRTGAPRLSCFGTVGPLSENWWPGSSCQFLLRSPSLPVLIA